MEDVFNMENESFMQETQLMENEYSVNLPTRFSYKKKTYNGWINVVNPFGRALFWGLRAAENRMPSSTITSNSKFKRVSACISTISSLMI